MGGCWFHFSQCLVGHIGDCGLIKLYRDKEDHHFYQYMRCYLMLPLLPQHLIKFAFNILISLSELNVPKDLKDNFQKFIVYMKRTWMDGIYKVNEWCVYNQWLRTNNQTECCNFTSRLDFGHHPNYDTWVQKLAFQFATEINKYNKWTIHHKTKARPPKERLKNELLQSEWNRIKTDESPGSIILFLKQCSLAMKLSNEKLILMLENQA